MVEDINGLKAQHIFARCRYGAFSVGIVVGTRCQIEWNYRQESMPSGLICPVRTRAGNRDRATTLDPLRALDIDYRTCDVGTVELGLGLFPLPLLTRSSQPERDSIVRKTGVSP